MRAVSAEFDRGDAMLGAVPRLLDEVVAERPRDRHLAQALDEQELALQDVLRSLGSLGVNGTVTSTRQSSSRASISAA